MIELFHLEKIFKVIESNHQLHHSPCNLHLLWSAQAGEGEEKQHGQFSLACVISNGEGQKTLKNDKTNWKLSKLLHLWAQPALHKPIHSPGSLLWAVRGLRAWEHPEVTALPKPQLWEARGLSKLGKPETWWLYFTGLRTARSRLSSAWKYHYSYRSCYRLRNHSTVGSKDRDTRKGRRDKTIHKLVIAACLNA